MGTLLVAGRISQHALACLQRSCTRISFCALSYTTLVFADYSALLHKLLSRVLAASCSCYITTQVGLSHVSPLSRNPSLYPIGHVGLSATAFDLRLRSGILSFLSRAMVSGSLHSTLQHHFLLAKSYT